MDYKSDIEILEAECRRLGYNRICPEALELIGDINSRGWEDKALRGAYYSFMNGMRALFAKKS